MKRSLAALFFVFSLVVAGQPVDSKHIFSDTSLYFIQSMDSLNPVQLSTEELALAEEILLEAVKDFNEYRQRHADSLRPKKKRRKEQVWQINVEHYFFRLIPFINAENQKAVYINADCKDWYSTQKRKSWKKQFIDGNAVWDGGSCFIYVDINLTLKIYTRIRMNGEG